jgi:hypothetical protein
MKKKIIKQLDEAGFSLAKDIFGWIVIEDGSKVERRFSTLGGIARFLADRA